MQRVDSKYLKRITRTVNVDGYLKDVEDEVLEEIAAAIKRTDNKVNFAMLRMEMAEEDLDKAIAAADRAAEIEAVERFNTLRKEAETARRNLMIHRQACGFKTDNFRTLLKLYPIGPERAVGKPKAELAYVEKVADNVTKGEWLSWRHKKMNAEEWAHYASLPDKPAKRQYLESLLEASPAGDPRGL